MQLPGRAEAAVAAHPDLSFRAYRDGDLIGDHLVRVRRRGNAVHVEVTVRLEVKFAFITWYRYVHTNREVWVDGRLRSLESETDDNGVAHQVLARSEEDRLLVDGMAGRLALPAEIATTTYWDEASVRHGAWLDTQSGRLVRSTVTPHPPAPVQIGERNVLARRYVLAGDLNCELWYDDHGWAKLRFAAPDGSTIEYLRNSV